jgi:Tol biopolymer transport system component
VDGNTAWFYPFPGFETGEHQVALTSGVILKDGTKVAASDRWTFTVQETRVIFIGNILTAPELMLVNADGSNPEQLTRTSGKVYDYDVSKDGRLIIYSIQNDEGGVDLWQKELATDQDRILIRCGTEACITPAISLDKRFVIYSRLDPKNFVAGNGQGRIWSAELATGNTADLFKDQAIVGISPVWSPNGQYLSFYDWTAGGIRLLDTETGDTYIIPTPIRNGGGWAPDSSFIVFPDYAELDGIGYTILQKAMIKDRIISTITKSSDNGYEYGTPVISSDGKTIAVGVRPLVGPPTRQIWIYDLTGQVLLSATVDFSFTHGGYSWSPDSRSLLYQRYQIGAGSQIPEIGIWDKKTSNNKVIFQNAGFPSWLP